MITSAAVRIFDKRQNKEIILPVYKAASNLGFGRWQM